MDISSGAQQEAHCCQPLPTSPAPCPAPLRPQTRGSLHVRSLALQFSPPCFGADCSLCQACPSFPSLVSSLFVSQDSSSVSPAGNNNVKASPLDSQAQPRASPGEARPCGRAVRTPPAASDVVPPALLPALPVGGLLMLTKPSLSL